MPLDEVLHDQQVPLLVVLIGAGLHDALEDPPGQARAPRVAVHGPVAHALPRLVRHAGDDLQHGELGERALLAVHEVDGLEHHLGQQAVLHARGGERVPLGPEQLVAVELRRAGVHVGPVVHGDGHVRSP
nr:hypothetical protein [Nonomuraea aurantiaca]